MLYAVVATSSIARGRVTSLDVTAAKSASRRGRGDDARPTAPTLAQDPDEKTQPVHVPARPPAERPGALRQPADRGGDRRDAWRRRRKAPRCSTRRYEAEPARVGLDGTESFVPPVVGIGDPPKAARAIVEAGPRVGRHGRSTRPTRRRRSTTMRWSRTPSWRHGTAIRCRSTRRARAWAWRRAASPGCSASRRRTSTSAAPSWAAASARRA